MRHWLLGSWIAQQHGASFFLVNLVRWGTEQDVEGQFGSRCRQDRQWHFLRATWESIWDSLAASGLRDETVTVLDRYFSQKTCGYDNKGKLRKAFTAVREAYDTPLGPWELARLSSEGDSLWFHNRDAWRRVWGPPQTMQQLVFRILQGSNDAGVDLRHEPATECDLDYHIARNIVGAFLASGWQPPEGVTPKLNCGHQPSRPR